MGYDKAMFHRMAEELGRMAESGTTDIDDNDLYTALDAIARMAVEKDLDGIACHSIELAACRLGGMYEVFQEQPEIMANLIDEIMEHEHYHQFDNLVCDGWVKVY